MVSNINKTRLPLGLKPSNSTTLSFSSGSDETLSPTTSNTDISPTPSSAIQSSSSSTLSKQSKPFSITTILTEQQMITKKTKSKSKATIIKSNYLNLASQHEIFVFR
ncbi:unnamed protein product [Rotaria sp. Silwood2]|nr:unnamed protein product [Rotaria sp. Silwood2]CAF3223284.1 unnamed protein product [Rotaria sp. Silwood2]CAF3272255.1 unnamed protein product [Rotaria sp. Silwood2]CAF4501377.1 unnamed protein product [Rotaria sp. Silwood2]CAF4618000.1 unnamed protein product [Rotaria sp. Silwood2]